MSHFLAENYKKTITLKQLTYSEIQTKERHHITIGKADLCVSDVVIFQSEADELLNAKQPSTARDTWAVITTKESFNFADKTLCVYGFNTIEDLPKKLIDMANSIYNANVSLSESNQKMMQAGVEYL
jgi:hypothetical protein